MAKLFASLDALRRFLSSRGAFVVMTPVMLVVEAIILRGPPFSGNARSMPPGAAVTSVSKSLTNPAIRDLAVSDDGDFLDVVQGDADWVRRDAHTGRELSGKRLSKTRLTCLQLRRRDDTWVGIHLGDELEIVHQGRSVWRGRLPDQGEDESLMKCSLCPERNVVAVISFDETLWLLDFNDAEATPRRRYPLGERIAFVKLSPSGDRLLLVMDSRQMFVWDVAREQIVLRIDAAQCHPQFASWSGDGRRVIGSGNSPEVAVWDAQTGALLRQMSLEHRLILSAELSADGRLAAIGDGNEIRLWDLDTGNELPSFPGHHEVISALHFADGGRTLFSGDIQGGLRRWSLSHDREIWAVP